MEPLISLSGAHIAKERPEAVSATGSSDELSKAVAAIHGLWISIGLQTSSSRMQAKAWEDDADPLTERMFSSKHHVDNPEIHREDEPLRIKPRLLCRQVRHR